MHLLQVHLRGVCLLLRLSSCDGTHQRSLEGGPPSTPARHRIPLLCGEAAQELVGSYSTVLGSFCAQLRANMRNLSFFLFSVPPHTRRRPSAHLLPSSKRLYGLTRSWTPVPCAVLRFRRISSSSLRFAFSVAPRRCPERCLALQSDAQPARLRPHPLRRPRPQQRPPRPLPPRCAPNLTAAKSRPGSLATCSPFSCVIPLKPPPPPFPRRPELETKGKRRVRICGSIRIGRRRCRGGQSVRNCRTS